jgi:RimJ/RimL family protein N-acetyltransferase
MNTNIWRGEKVRLRPVEQKDLDAIIASTEEPDTEADRYENYIHFPLSKTQDRDQLAKLGEKRDDDTLFCMVEDLEGNHVGYLNTFDVNRRNGAFKYGILIKRPYWGKGYAPDAIKILLRYYFRELRYQKCTVLIYSFNQRSIHLHEKLGFQYEGRLRRMLFTNGNYYDEIYYGITAEEFDEIEPKLELKDFVENNSDS